MSFRRRLTLFFVLIVVLPMVALGALVLQVTGSSRTGKADARLAAGLETALTLYRTELAGSRQAVREAARDPQLAAALRSGKPGPIRAVASRLVREGDLASLAVLDQDGEQIARAGVRRTVADSEVTLETDGRIAGELVGSVVSATSYASRVRDLTGRNAAISGPDGQLATTTPIRTDSLPPAGSAETLEIGGTDQRAASAALGDSGEEPLRLTLVGQLDSGGLAATRPLVAAALALFFAIALAFVAMLLRSLQGQVAAMLSAARRIGSGDFTRKLPVEGEDEMAGLAREFNQMSDKLSHQMSELRRQRTELEQSVRRIGEAFASGLDRAALLEIVAETAASACEAEHARIVLSGFREPEVVAGQPLSRSMAAAVRKAEEDAFRRPGMADGSVEDAFALAHPLAPAGEGVGEESRSPVSPGVMTIVRRGHPFEDSQRDVLRYLIGQASVSIENVELHELVAEQAITDELTALPNNRRFRTWIATEAARAERFGHDLSLLMLDIDDFKHFNDTYGHLQGDEVLRTVGRVLAEESRGVDMPARYGGEEFAIGLPETSLEGAFEFAERVRERIASTQIPRVDGDGSLRVTASVGVATASTGGASARGLIEAADGALYAAKRGGKNRTERAAGQVGRGEEHEEGAGKEPPAAKIPSDG